jgi:uncharacterized RDD family membrane protein YckC
MKTFDPSPEANIENLRGKQMASFARRSVAFSLDFLISFVFFTLIFIYGTIALMRLGLINLQKNILIKFDFTNWYSIAAIVLYFTITTYFGNGKTPGKKMAGIRVVSLLHAKISFWQCLERSLGYCASVLEFGFGFLQFFLNHDRKTVHDRIAETIVIRD